MKIAAGSIEIDVSISVKLDGMSEIEIHDILMCLTFGIFPLRRDLENLQGKSRETLERTLAAGEHLRAELAAARKIVISHTEGRD